MLAKPIECHVFTSKLLKDARSLPENKMTSAVRAQVRCAWNSTHSLYKQLHGWCSEYIVDNCGIVVVLSELTVQVALQTTRIVIESLWWLVQIEGVNKREWSMMVSQ
jgi:hypothetical protein